MKDSLEYFREKGKHAEVSLIAMGCMQCTACKKWMDKDYIRAGKCNECSGQSDIFYLTRGD